MRTPATLFVLLALSLPAAAQAPADAPNAQTRQVSGYHAVEVANGIDLFLRQGPEAVVVSASTVDGRDHIRTTVEKGVLKIWYARPVVGWGFGRRPRQLRAYVSAPALDGLSASGGSDIRVESTLTGKVLGLDLSGGSDFQGSVAVDSLAITASGGSDVSIAGRAGRLSLQVSGGSDVAALGLVVETGAVSASGGSDVQVTVNRELAVQASGGSDVRYAGGGDVRAVSRSGGSGVRRVNR